MKRIAFIIEKFVDIPVVGEPAIHINLIDYLIEKQNDLSIDVYFNINAISTNSPIFQKMQINI